MIVCSCNIISDCNIKKCIQSLDKSPTVGLVFKELGCKPDCATCVQTIIKLINEHKQQSELAE